MKGLNVHSFNYDALRALKLLRGTWSKKYFLVLNVLNSFQNQAVYLQS